MSITKLPTLHPYHGEMLSVAQLSERSGVPEHRIRSRLHRGWSIEEAVDITTVWVDIQTVRSNKEIAQENDLTTAKGRRTEAAAKIAQQLVCGDLRNFSFRCVIPMLEYTFSTNTLRYCVSFDSTAECTTASLTGFCPGSTTASLCRRYVVTENKIKEMV